MCVIFGTYDKKDFSESILEYQSLIGTKATRILDVAQLYDFNNNLIGNIQFDSIIRSTLTLDPIYHVTENIAVILNDGTTVFTINQFEGLEGSFYPVGSKYILPIFETLGPTNVGKRGYLVIDVFENTRNVYIKLE